MTGHGDDAPIPTSTLRAALWTGAVVLLVSLAIAPGAIDNIDTRVCVHAARSLLDRGTTALTDPTFVERAGDWTAVGVDGRVYPKFGVGETLWLVPFVALGRVVALFVSRAPGVVEEFVVSLSSSVAIAAAAVFSVLTCAVHLRCRTSAAVLGTLAWIFGTFQASYAGSSYLETPLAATVVVALWFALRARATGGLVASALAGVAMAVAVSIKAAAAVTVPFLLLALWWPGGLRRLARVATALLPLALCGVLLAWHNEARFGDPLRSGYPPAAVIFRHPLLDGLRDYLAAPDLALVLFAPACLLALAGLPELRRRDPLLLVAGAGTFAAVAVLHAKFFAWHGGTAYGPRYLIPAIAGFAAPAVAVLVDRLLAGGRRGVVALVLGVAVASQVPSLLVSPLEYHTLRGTFKRRGADPDSVRPRLVTDVLLLSAKLRGETDEYDMRDFARRPELAPADPRYVVPRLDRGLSMWWARAAREGTTAAYAVGALLLAGAGGAAFALVRTTTATGDSPPS